MSVPVEEKVTTDISQSNALLTQLLVGVSQQFMHMLRLRRLGRSDIAARIKLVDDIDFPNAMQIIDLLTGIGTRILIEPHPIAPARSVKKILQAELKFEMEFEVFLRDLKIKGKAENQRLARAKAPREAYRYWLSETLEDIPTDPCCHPDVRDDDPRDAHQLLSALLQLMEQALVHAFANWHEDRIAEASTSWQISGAAMLYLTALSDHCGTDNREAAGIEVPGSTAAPTTGRYDADMRLVANVATAAHSLAATCDDRSLKNLCRKVAEDCERLIQTKNGDPINARLGQSRVFGDFRETRERFIC